MDRIGSLLKILEKDNNDVFVKYALALEYLSRNNLSEAEKYFIELLDKEPDYLASYYQYGLLLEQKGDIKEASEVLEKGILLAERQNDLHTKSELQIALDNLS
jgi:tetratricopeptide (TPR) repeat protein